MNMLKAGGMAVVLFAVSCASAETVAPHCPAVDVRYVGEKADAVRLRVAIFSIINRGEASIELPLERNSTNIIHGRYASTEQRVLNDGAWEEYNPNLDEMLAPRKTMAISPGQEKEFSFDVNGLLLNDRRPEMEYSIVVKAVSGCVYRSLPFNPSR
ncbi:hypothetical protein [Stenotrophomonas acidaminiphila]|uniref:hypothetical protein n=1 Tax=Stenotrophomonas acidaminiphila TaxID=128780 RepID=UPI0024AE85B2|nr:hypothetical protein [Stenotrophomonas acidaminiphila]WHL19207.1 hypothetical protein QLF99_01840 [Stenotrophomonas acidaminiphila]